jgi:anti-sigma B factor antagonist
MAASASADIPQFDISSGPGPEDAYVVRVTGEVDMSHEEQLRAELHRAVETDTKGIVVDLTECEFIDSSGIRALLLSREEKQPDGNSETLAVAASSDQILRILGVMGLDQVIPIRPTVEEAAAALSG